MFWIFGPIEFDTPVFYLYLDMKALILVNIYIYYLSIPLWLQGRVQKGRVALLPPIL